MYSIPWWDQDLWKVVLRPVSRPSKSQDLSDHTMVFQSSAIPSLWVCSYSILILADRGGTRCGLSPSRFRHVVHRICSSSERCCNLGLFGYCHFPVSWKQAGDSPLTSLTNKAFPLTELPLTGCFLFFRTFRVTPRDCYAWEAEEISSYWDKTPNALSGTSYYGRVKVTWITFFPDSGVRYEQLNLFPKSVSFYIAEIWLDECKYLH